MTASTAEPLHGRSFVSESRFSSAVSGGWKGVKHRVQVKSDYAPFGGFMRGAEGMMRRWAGLCVCGRCGAEGRLRRKERKSN